MKLSLIALMIVAVLSVTGCTNTENTQLRSQVDALQKKVSDQEAREAQLQKAKEAGATSFETAWEWVKTNSSNAWNSDTSVDARARFHRCWDDLKASGK